MTNENHERCSRCGIVPNTLHKLGKRKVCIVCYEYLSEHVNLMDVAFKQYSESRKELQYDAR